MCRRIQDGETISYDNRILAKNHKLQLIGTGRELVGSGRGFDYNESHDPVWGGWVGFEDDNNNQLTSGYIMMEGTDILDTATEPEINDTPSPPHKWGDGHIPDANTPYAIPDKTYKLKCRMMADSAVSNAIDIRIYTGIRTGLLIP